MLICARDICARLPCFDMMVRSGERGAVLHEIRNVKQEAAMGGRRRWFESDGFELVLWLDAVGTLIGFQICYDFGEGEHALTWRAVSGFTHASVDSGDATPLKNQTPVLMLDGEVPWAEITRRFDERSETLEASLREWVRGKLAERADLNTR